MKYPNKIGQAEYWKLNLTKQMAAVDYNSNLAVARDLDRRLRFCGACHDDYATAEQAAAYISKNPLVLKVEITKFVEEKVKGFWSNGNWYDA